jgi:hypothetical protein
MPTIARFMDIKIPEKNAYEVDGIPFIGDLSVISPKAQFNSGKIQLQWQAVDKSGSVKIWLSTTNQFKSGIKDNYQLVDEIPVSQQKVIIDVSKQPSDFYKIVVEAPHNFLNRWIVLKR